MIKSNIIYFIKKKKSITIYVLISNLLAFIGMLCLGINILQDLLIIFFTMLLQMYLLYRFNQMEENRNEK